MHYSTSVNIKHQSKPRWVTALHIFINLNLLRLQNNPLFSFIYKTFHRNSLKFLQISPNFAKGSLVISLFCPIWSDNIGSNEAKETTAPYVSWTPIQKWVTLDHLRTFDQREIHHESIHVKIISGWSNSFICFYRCDKVYLARIELATTGS